MEAPKRPTVFGFHVKNLSDLVADPIEFLNLSLTQRDDAMTKYSVKEVHFINMGDTTAVRIRTKGQEYMSKWKVIINELFSEAIKTLGSDAIMDLDTEKSAQIKGLFRKREGSKDPSVQAFKVQFLNFLNF
jgi:hypothetical protein